MSGLRNITKVIVSRDVQTRTRETLRQAGKRGLEGMALWAAQLVDDSCVVREVIVPQQQGIRSDHGLAVTVSGEELHRINVHLYRSKLRLIAQVHSHPTHAYHSAMDDRYAIATTTGAFSIVVPDFAAGPFEIQSCATYRLLPGWWVWDRAPRWRKVAPSAAAAIFRFQQGL